MDGQFRCTCCLKRVERPHTLARALSAPTTFPI
jgi:hypothetical protein